MREGEKVWVGSACVEREGEVTGGEGEEGGHRGASLNWVLVAWGALTVKKNIQKDENTKKQHDERQKDKKRERREGIEVQVSTGYWLPGGL